MDVAESDISSSFPASGEDEKEIVTSKVPQLSPGDAAQKEEPEDNLVVAAKKPFKFKLSVFMICLVSVVVAMDAVIVASTLPAITVSLKGSSLEAFWVGTSYLLAQTVRSPYPLLAWIFFFLHD